MILRRIVVASAVGFLLLAVGTAIYAARVHASAQALIYSAAEIRSTADAKRLIAVWRGRTDWNFEEAGINQFGEDSYDFHVDNSWLYRLHIVPPTMAGMSVMFRNNELRTVALIVYSGWEPNKTSGVWVHEWFGSNERKDLCIDTKNEPLQAIIDFPSTMSDSERKKLFGMNAYCFIKPRGCGSAEAILPENLGLKTGQRRLAGS
jgi:hypothetical protein